MSDEEVRECIMREPSTGRTFAATADPRVDRSLFLETKCFEGFYFQPKELKPLYQTA